MKWFLIFVFLCVLVALGAAGWVWHGYTAPGPLTAENEVLIERGTGFKNVAKQLQNEGVIRDARALVIGGLVEGKNKKIKAGEYQFSPGMSARDIIDKMARGDVITRSVTIPEGLTVAQISQLLAKEDKLSGAVPMGIAEGSLLPETYQFLRGDSRASIMTRMQKDMEAYLEKEWQARDTGIAIATKAEAIIIASIVEKETGVGDERARVAAVYENRLKLGMKLQADPTVAYGIVQRDGGMERALTKADLMSATPYNTYVIGGLPAGPICNPGKDAIRAVLHPANVDDLYFVATGTGDGRHHFAETMKDHEANVRAYRGTQKR